MAEPEVIRRSKMELVESIPKAVIYAGTAFVIWLFTKVLFVPLGDTVLWGDLKAATVIVAIAVVTILVIVLKILREIRDICNALAGLIAWSIDKSAASTEYQIYQRAVRSLVYVMVVAVMFLLFGTLLNEIHPALSGIVLIIVFLWAVGTLYSTGVLLSSKIDAKVRKTTARLFHIEEEKKPKA